MYIWAIFLTGLTVGGLTCLAVQGGLLASVIAARDGNSPGLDKKHTFWATASFLAAKLVAYTILGFILGGLGGALNINPGVQTTRFLTRMVRNQSKSKDLFAPALLGAMTIFIPCGTTIAMETLAITSANAFLGASIIAAFVLGTMPLFFGVG